jgi:AcrR family transcriptional regulator
VAEVSTPTRERIVIEAMRLFAQRGFRGTSVSQIEAAAGLSPGSGGLYHHFSSKDAVLAEGVARHLARLDALRDIRQVFAGIGDIESQLAITARYYLAELDSQADLLRLLVAEARRKPDLLTSAVDHLVARTYEDFAEWLGQAAPQAPRERVRAVSAIGLGALLASRLTRDVLGVGSSGVSDEIFVATWAEMMARALDDAGRPKPGRKET